MTKNLPRGDNHPLKFLGTEVLEEIHARFAAAARQTGRTRAGLLRHVIASADRILSSGDNHLRKESRKTKTGRNRAGAEKHSRKGDGEGNAGNAPQPCRPSIILPQGDNHQAGSKTVNHKSQPADAGN